MQKKCGRLAPNFLATPKPPRRFECILRSCVGDPEFSSLLSFPCADQFSQAVRNNASQRRSSNSSRIVGTCNFPFRFKCCSREVLPPTTALAKESSGGSRHVDCGLKITVIGLEMSWLRTISAYCRRRRCIVSPSKLASKSRRRHPLGIVSKPGPTSSGKLLVQASTARASLSISSSFFRKTSSCLCSSVFTISANCQILSLRSSRAEQQGTKDRVNVRPARITQKNQSSSFGFRHNSFTAAGSLIFTLREWRCACLICA